ncbi:MAG: hypothetical protein HQ564_03180 [Candidatus Saganbacteria bacterium]|nr:hypothetical protein [Candidatus Saganbacteria bacterium]
MVISALVVLLFLLGFGSMIISHAHREIHITPKRVQMATGIFIIFFTSVMVLYLSGYLFSRTMIHGERPFEVGAGPIKTWMASFDKEDRALEQCLNNLNTTLQQQAMQAASAKKDQLQAELVSIKNELKSLKKTVTTSQKSKTKKVKYRRTTSRRRSTLYTRRASTKVKKANSSPRTITNLVGYDHNNYTPQNEPILLVSPVLD